MVEELCERMREERKRLGMKQWQLADMAAVSRETWSRYESGKIQPGTDVWVALAMAGANVYYIFTGVRSRIVITDTQKNKNVSKVSEESGVYNVMSPILEGDELVAMYDQLEDEKQEVISQLIMLLNSN